MTYRLLQISEKDFLRLGGLLTERYGIKMPPEKKILFQSRLQKRLLELEMTSFQEYGEFILNPLNTESELTRMVDYLSTNKTDFFREVRHFDLILSTILPELCNSGLPDYLIRCWSAGCSTGQEAFSLAMTLEEYKLKTGASFDYFILGSDVSARVLEIARSGIYPFSQSALIPHAYLKRYVLKSKDPKNQRIKIAKSIRSKTSFIYGNLMDANYRINHKFRIIFIRNTLIYFGREDQRRILERVLGHLEPKGYLFIGHSESLIDFNLPVSLIGPGIYQKN
ncbi:MAG: CheR family methyltransferase [Prolixibacteraceae bacterium]